MSASFPGKVGNARVWTRALSQMEVLHSLQTSAFGEHVRELLFDFAYSAGVAPGIHSHTLASPIQLCNKEHGVESYSMQTIFMNTSMITSKHLRTLHPKFRITTKVQPASVLVVIPVEGAFDETAAQAVVQCLSAWTGVDNLLRLQIVFSLTRPQPIQQMPSLGCVQVRIYSPSSDELTWNEALLAGLKHTSFYSHVLISSLEVLASQNWLHGLLEVLDNHPEVGAVHAKVLEPDRSISHMGYTVHRMYVPELDVEAGTPISLFEGYPSEYALSMRKLSVPGTGCLAYLMHSKLLVEHTDLFSQSLGPQYSCMDTSLRLALHGLTTMVTPESVFYRTQARTQSLDMPEAMPPKLFYDLWAPQLNSYLHTRLQATASVSWVMHCGGSMGNEAFNMIQGMEGLLPLRAQIQRGFSWCEHNDVLSGMPSSFRSRVSRLRRLSSHLPSDIIVYHKDYRQLGEWVWPPGNTSSYLIGRYMFEMDKVHKQWLHQCKTQLDEVWVPSTWFANKLAEQGVPERRIRVIPESIDVHYYDPSMWSPLALPGRRKFAFLAVFKLEERKGWRELLKAYVTEFSSLDDVSLFIHTSTYPDVSFDRGRIMSVFSNYLKEQKLAEKAFPQIDSHLPHFDVIGKHMSVKEMIRLYRSVDAFVLPSHGEGWGLPYMEAMAMGLPVIATNWSGMTEFMNSDVALMLNCTPKLMQSSDQWFNGAQWAEPDIGHLRTLMRFLVQSPAIGKVLGSRARRHIHAKYDNHMVGKLIVNRVSEIQGKRAKNEVRDHFRQVDVFMDPGYPGDVQSCISMHEWAAEDKAVKGRCSFREATDPLKLAIISTYPPRPCGIGTFTRMLIKAVIPKLPRGSTIEVIPLIRDVSISSAADDNASSMNGNDNETQIVLLPEAERHGITFSITRTIRHNNLGDYSQVARYVNRNGFHVALLQHEFAIFGGNKGCFVLCLANMLRVPVATVIHTLSDNLWDIEHGVLQHLAHLSERVVIMSNSSRNSFTAYHGVPSSVVTVIPHGVFITELPSEVQRQLLRERLGWGKRKVVMQNGLLHTGKGLDVVAKSIPDVIKAHPDFLYVVVGVPHPACGAACVDYVKWVRQYILQHNLTDHVQWLENFVSDEELSDMLHAADVYVMAYKDRITSNSGTLSMAMAAGKTVIATPFEHARYALPGRGLLVPYDDVAALSRSIIELLGDPERLKAYGDAAYHYMKDKAWHVVGKAYVDMFNGMSCW
eukprot:CAMPEP_0202919946 /NCGR_PEP_ID=MMETSP1392-20130828/76598_1 /ASSEMBLY_ACC=CAM_ASM_000868 /TAXON_ID=225041 /ORGANISM="Chlamydomonas chlamydogama, Strain SAG 11-48b" /LENGTH=1223 /DNA_ID=CAMNT_0049613415 /DNA_START=1514 /DNA_END=5182 /DNA_ORIENTATION=+